MKIGKLKIDLELILAIIGGFGLILYLYYHLYITKPHIFYQALFTTLILVVIFGVLIYFLGKNIKKKAKIKYNVGDKVKFSHTSPTGEIIEDDGLSVYIKTKIGKHLVTKIDK